MLSFKKWSGVFLLVRLVRKVTCFRTRSFRIVWGSGEGKNSLKHIGIAGELWRWALGMSSYPQEAFKALIWDCLWELPVEQILKTSVVNLYSCCICVNNQAKLNENRLILQYINLLGLSLIELFSLQVVSNFLRPHELSTPGFPIHHHLPEFAQTPAYWISVAIQSSHPLSPSSPAFNLSQHQGLFQWVGSSHQVVKY